MRMAATKVSAENTPMLIRRPAGSLRFPSSRPRLLRVGAVRLQQSILDDVGEAKGNQDDEQAMLADDALEQETLQCETDTKRDRQHDDGRCHRIEAKLTVRVNSAKPARTMKSPW